MLGGGRGWDWPTTSTRVPHRDRPRGYGCGTVGWRQQACSIVATRRLVDRRSAGASERASDEVCCQRFESSGPLPSSSSLSVVASNSKLKIWAPTWRQFAQFFFVEYSCLQGRVLQARFASAFIRSAARLLRNHFWLIDWLIIIITIISFFLSLFSSCSLAFSIVFLWVFTLVLR